MFNIDFFCHRSCLVNNFIFFLVFKGWTELVFRCKSFKVLSTFGITNKSHLICFRYLWQIWLVRQQLVKKATFLLQKKIMKKKFDVPGIWHLESKVWYICRWSVMKFLILEWWPPQRNGPKFLAKFPCKMAQNWGFFTSEPSRYIKMQNFLANSPRT